MEQSESKGKGMDGTYYSFDNNEEGHQDGDGQEEQNNHAKGYLSKRINIFGHDRGGIKRGRSKAIHSRLRSRNKVIDAWLDGEDGRDAYVYLEDFIAEDDIL